MEEFIRQIRIPVLGVHALTHALTQFIPPGMMLEFGVWKGTTITEIAKAHPDRQVFGFDSFEGLPETWTRSDGDFEAGRFNLNGQLPRVPSNVTLVKGWFN